MKTTIRVAFMAWVGLMLVGCASMGTGAVPVDAAMQASLADGAKLNPEAARTWLNRYRKSKGLEPVELDDDLMRMAEEQARAMAAADRMSHHSSAGTFTARLADSGYDAVRGVENIGMGYRSIAHQFKGWRKSSGHNENMLVPEVRDMGIAAVRSTTGQKRVYTALVLGQPAEKPRTARGPAAGTWGAPLPKLW